ncbi:MAG: asparagine--tRNA ligase, partial [Clostridia bacterium]|nr:asparagine--tRNA ligase [Clostridia bacterium]
MESIEIRELYRGKETYAGKSVTVCGWVRSIRASKAFGFIVLSDGTFFKPLQIVYDEKVPNFAEIAKL